MSDVVADAGPIISLAQIQRLDLLRSLYGAVAIPIEVAQAARLVRSSPLRADRLGAPKTYWG